MAVAVSCPACGAQLQLKTAPAPGAVGRCPRCRAAVPLAPADEQTRTFHGQATKGSQPAETGTVVQKAPPPVRERALDTDFLAPPEAPDELGRLGPYRVLGVLGRGGMGVVYRAEQTQLRRQVALKVMLPEYASNATWKSRFLREARAQAAVEHGHVVAIYEADERDGVAYIAMQLLKGQTLGAALKQNPRPPLKEVLRIGREMAEGLAAAHEVGLIHRDIKPANVWLDGRSRRVKILDFGLARSADTGGGAVDQSLTVQGTILGTPSYMSPEQARGERTDHRTDLWSLGVALYQMTAGELPFIGSTPITILAAVTTGRPLAPAARNPEVPAAVSDLVMRLLAKSVVERPQSAEAVAEELQRLEAGGATALVAVPVAVPNDPWANLDTECAETGITGEEPTEIAAPDVARSRRGVALALAVGAVVLALAGAAALMLGRDRPAEPAGPEPVVVRGNSTPPKPIPLKEPDKGNEPRPAPVGAPVPFDPAAHPVHLRRDFSSGEAAGWPKAGPSPGGRSERGYTKSALYFKSTAGRWQPRYGPVPADVAIEVRARVVSEAGAWMIGANGFTLAVDALGVLALDPGATANSDDSAARRTFPHKAIRTRGEWNTVLAVARAGRVSAYVNGEEVAVAEIVGDRDRLLSVGIDARTTVAEVEYERVTVWDLTAPKK